MARDRRGGAPLAVCCALDGGPAERARAAWDSGLLARLADERLLPAVEPCAVGDWPFALRFGRPARVTFGAEWCARGWHAAAAYLLRLAARLSEAGLTLGPVPPTSIQFLGASPQLLDFGALRPLSNGELARALLAMRGAYILPVVICCLGRSGLLRRALRSPFPLRESDFPEASSLMTEFRTPARSGDDAADTLREYAAILQALPATRPTSGWLSYYERAAVLGTRKEEALEYALGALKPLTVLDLGSNCGRYSCLAAARGARVTAVDRDEACVTALFSTAERAGTEILPLVLDLVDPTPAYGPSPAPFPSAAARLKSEMVLALALTHHLLLSRAFSMRGLATLLHELTGRWLVVEFVPLGAEAHCSYPPTMGLADWYNLPAFVGALRERFSAVSALGGDAASGERCLILCARRARDRSRAEYVAASAPRESRA
jgi:hypothetical protein